MPWKQGQERYNTLVENIVAHSTSNEHVQSAAAVVNKAKDCIPEFVSGLRVMDLVAIHEYLMYMSELRLDPRFPVYVYSGGDRVMAVTRYLLKNIEIELARQLA